jgi:HAD superfamily hydrolase (TIGR01509 family)
MIDFKAVLFDMDGTLALNAHLHHQAWEVCLLERYGYRLSKTESRVHGGKTKAIVESLLGNVFPDDASSDEFHEYKEARYRQIAKGKITPVAGLFEFLEYLEAQNIKMALVTSADLKNTRFVLGDLKLESRFAVRVMGEDVTRGKPDPEPFALGATRLGVPAKDCLVFEDSLIGVQSGVSAGARVVGVATMQSKAALLEAGATWAVLDYLECLSLFKKV